MLTLLGLILRLDIRQVLRMLGNLATDALVGSVPLVGDAVDFLYKPNERNLRMLEQWTAGV